MRTRLLVLLIVVLSVIMISGCGKKEAAGPPKKSWEMTENEIDRLPEETRIVFWREKRGWDGVNSKENDFAEAREWCTRKDATGFEMSVKEMAKFAEEIYAAGAAKVYVTGIVKFDPAEFAGEPIVRNTPEDPNKPKKIFEMSGSIVAEFPAEAEARAKFIAFVAKTIDQKEDEPYPTQDLGQQYVMFIID